MLLHVVMLVAVILITPKRIAQFFNDMSLGLRAMGWKGILIIFVCASESGRTTTCNVLPLTVR